MAMEIILRKFTDLSVACLPIAMAIASVGSLWFFNLVANDPRPDGFQIWVAVNLGLIYGSVLADKSLDRKINDLQKKADELFALNQELSTSKE